MTAAVQAFVGQIFVLALTCTVKLGTQARLASFNNQDVLERYIRIANPTAGPHHCNYFVRYQIHSVGDGCISSSSISPCASGDVQCRGALSCSRLGLLDDARASTSANLRASSEERITIHSDMKCFNSSACHGRRATTTYYIRFNCKSDANIW